MLGEVGFKLPSAAAMAKMQAANPNPLLPNPQQLTAAASALANMLPKWRLALARVRDGVGNARWAMTGDSITKGHAAAGSFPNPAYWQHNQSWHISRMLNAAGLNTHVNATFGSYSDSRLTLAGGYTGTGGGSFGGSLILGSAAGTITFNPSQNVDNFTIYYLQGAGLGSFTYSINGGAQSATVSMANATSLMVALPVTGLTLGLNTITITWVSGSTFFAGFSGSDSTQKWIEIDNGGAEGFTAAQYLGTTNVYDPIKVANFLNPDLISIQLGVNDWDGLVTPVPVYIANMRALILQARTTSDVIIFTPTPTQPGSSAAPNSPAVSVQQAYVYELFKLCVAMNVPVVDYFGRWLTYSASSGFYFTDGLHPIGIGYADLAQAAFNVLGRP